MDVVCRVLTEQRFDTKYLRNAVGFPQRYLCVILQVFGYGWMSRAGDWFLVIMTSVLHDTAHACGKKSAMSMVGKSEMFEKIQCSKIDKLKEENDYTAFSTPSKNRQHQSRQPAPNQRNENDTYLMSQGSKNEKAFDIFNSNV